MSFDLPFEEALQQELDELRRQDRFRACPPFAGTPWEPRLNNQSVLNFCSNDYLGFARNPEIAKAASEAVGQHGSGATASRLVCGDLPPHRQLEDAVAKLVGSAAALTFPSGYQANLAAITAFAGPDDLIVSDAANHASLIDGCRLSRAKIRIFPHRDASAARTALREERNHRRRFLISESLFSMDGNFAPLVELRDIATEFGAVLVIDDAHALGLYGSNGAGFCNAVGVRPDIHIGTFGKAVGSAGGFVAGSRAVIQTLVNRARTFIFTTGTPPGVAAASAAGIRLLSGDAGEKARKRLFANLKYLSMGLELGEPERLSPIVPLVFGENHRALEVSQQLLSAGLFVQAIRPPTVAPGTARLRLTLSAAHETPDLDRLITHLKPRLPALRA